MFSLTPRAFSLYSNADGVSELEDLFVSRTMKIIADLPGTQALVDDVLVVAPIS